jgi:hypothetical protein
MGDAEVIAARKSLVAGRPDAAEALVRSARNADERCFFVCGLADGPTTARAVEHWVQSAPNSAAARLVAGEWEIRHAWKLRGGGAAKTVSGDGWQGFFKHLAIAEDHLRAAAALERRDALPWAGLLITCRGLQKGTEEGESLFKQAMARDPLHGRSHEAMMQILNPKWGGEYAKMREFVSQACSKAPRGNRLHALTAQRYIEDFIIAIMYGDERRPPAAFFGRPEYREGIQIAANSYFGGPMIRRRGDTHDLGTFAYFYWITGQNEAAAPLLAEIGWQVSMLPWNLSGFVDRVIGCARRECGV